VGEREVGLQFCGLWDLCIVAWGWVLGLDSSMYLLWPKMEVTSSLDLT
jgi:hypothetical protein